MSDEVNQDVVQEIVAPSTDDIAAIGQPKEPEYGSKEYNLREMRRLLEEQQREIKQLKAAREEPQDEEEDEDEFMTRRQFNELAKKQEASQQEDRTRLKFKDYDEVVTKENVDKLIEDDSDIADSIKYAPNPYASAYKQIKKAAFYVESKKEKPRNLDAEKIVKNAQKPVSADAISSRPLAQAQNYINMSDADKRDLYLEMMEFASRK